MLVWFNPGHLKGDCYYVGYLFIHSTTPEEPEKTRPEESLAVARCGAQGLARRGFAFHVFNPAIMIVYNKPKLMPVV